MLKFFAGRQVVLHFIHVKIEQNNLWLTQLLLFLSPALGPFQQLDLVINTTVCIKCELLSATLGSFLLKASTTGEATLNEMSRCPSTVQCVRLVFNSFEFAGGDCLVIFESPKPMSSCETHPIWPWL